MACKRKCNDCVECLAAHPEGKTCRDCRRFERCRAFLNRKGTETHCDWIPSAFQPAAPQTGETNA